MSEGQREALLGTTPLPQEVLDMVMEYSTITTYDTLRRVVESGNSGKYYFTPSLEEYERCMEEGLSLEEYERCMREVLKFKRLLSKQGFAFHVTLPEGLQYVGDRAFSGCSSLTSVTLPEGLHIWGWHAFENCTNLTSVTFPKKMRYVGEYAFRGCSSLTSVTFHEGLQQVQCYLAFRGCRRLQTIYVPENVSLDRDYNYLGIFHDVRIVRIRRAPEQGAGSANKRQRTELRF